MDGLDKSLPLAEGVVDTENAGKISTTDLKRYCLNCNTELSDAYCPHCGQKDIPQRQTLGELFTNFISSFWSYESKFFKTCQYLLFKPGFLATEYNAGRRERYFHPARMYVFMSFIFFLLFFSLPDDDSENEKSDNIELSQKDLEELREDLEEEGFSSIYGALPDSVLLDSVKTNESLQKILKGEEKGFRLTDSDYNTVAAYDSAEVAKPEKERDGWFVRRLTIRSIELNEKYKGKTDQFASDFGQSFMDNFSKVLFYLLPFFALLLKLLYIRRDFYYSEHLVLSIYYYNFFYLAASFIMLINLVPGLGFISGIIGFWIYFYFFFAMKRMYKQSWRKTILKFVIFSFMFMFLVLIGVSINAMVTLMVI
jgi:hypothetical protein